MRVRERMRATLITQAAADHGSPVSAITKVRVMRPPNSLSITRKAGSMARDHGHSGSVKYDAWTPATSAK
jgi:hypothetical protein